MGQLYVYDPWPTAVDTMGLCGPLTPTKTKVTMARNDAFELSIEHPIDPAGKWANLVPGNLIKANVPLRTTPIIPYGEGSTLQRLYGSGSYTAFVTSLKRYTVNSGASQTDRSVFSAPTGYLTVTQPIRLKIMGAGASVYIVGTLEWNGCNWALVAWENGRGWMKLSAITLAETLTLSDARSETERVIPSPRSRPQLFRIYKVEQSDTGVKASARHVAYDMAGTIANMVAISGAQCNTAAYTIFSGIAFGGLSAYVLPMYFCGPSDSVEVSNWTRVGAVEAMLGPSDSLTATWSMTLLRDNWNYTFIRDPEYDAGYMIEYGRNMLGVTMETDWDSMIDKIIPVGQTVKGKPLTVPTGTYTVDGASIAVTSGVVSSPSYSYAVWHSYVLDLGSSIKAASTGSSDLTAAYVKMIRAALKKFTNEKCDLPQVTLTVDFLQLGQTEEYKQFRDLDKLFFLDTVRTRDKLLGIDVTTQLNKAEWDPVLERYDSIELGSVRKNYARSRLASWQVPGLTSLQSYVDTISSLI